MKLSALGGLLLASAPASAQVIHNSLQGFEAALATPSQLLVDFEAYNADVHYGLPYPVSRNFGAFTYVSGDTGIRVDVTPFGTSTVPPNAGGAYLGLDVLSIASIAFFNYATSPQAVGFDYVVGPGSDVVGLGFVQADDFGHSQAFEARLPAGQGFVGFTASPGFHVVRSSITSRGSVFGFATFSVDNFRADAIPEVSSSLLAVIAGLFVSFVRRIR